MHYQPTIELDASPTVEQYTIGLRESIILLNGAFKWAKSDTGVWVYDGIGDMELAAVLDAYPVSLATRTYTVGATGGIVTSHVGLQLIPHWDLAALPAVDRLAGARQSERSADRGKFVRRGRTDRGADRSVARPGTATTRL